MTCVPENEARSLRFLERLLEFSGSLKLAIPLLLALAAYLGAATFYEARYGAQAVQHVVYGSRVFVTLLALLAITIMAAVIVRYPWKRKQTGFIITHIGLEVMLAGCLLSYYRSVDGRVAIAEGETVSMASLVTEQIQVVLPDARGKSIRTELWEHAGHPSLARFVAGLVWPLPEEPKWTAGRVVSYPLFENVRLEVLDWIPVAKADVVEHSVGGQPSFTFRAVRVAADKMSEALRAVKVALIVDDQRTEHWLGRGMMEQQVQTPRGVVRLAYGFDGLRLPFELKVVDFEKTNNPGANTAASFVSKVEVIQPNQPLLEQAITLNEPLAVDGLTFYQAGYDDTVTPPITVLSVRRDPGTLLKYLGSALIVGGIFTMFYMRAYFQRPIAERKTRAELSPVPQADPRESAECSAIS